MKLGKDLREFLVLLISKRVEFVIVGAHALAVHAMPRYTGDIDFFIRRSQTNAERVVACLVEFGFGTLQISAEDLTKEKIVVHLGRPPNRIDILTSISGVEFEDAWGSAVETEIDDVPVKILSRALLIQNKRASGRPKDIADLHALEASTEISRDK